MAGINQSLIPEKRFIERSGMCHMVHGGPDPTDTTAVKGRHFSSLSMQTWKREDGMDVMVLQPVFFCV